MNKCKPTETFTSHQLQFANCTQATYIVVYAANQYYVGRCDVRMTSQRFV